MNTRLVESGVDVRWVSLIYDAMKRWVHPDGFRSVHVGCLPWVIALLDHDALVSFKNYLASVQRLCRQCPGGGGGVGLLANADRRAFSAFIKDVGPLAGVDASVRPAGVNITTSNIFGMGFVPPTVPVALRAMRRLFSLHYMDGEGGADSVGSSLAFYVIFLTIHLFRDGNGRLARFIFAGDRVAANKELAVHEILALICLHRNKSHLFHLSAKCARGGDAGMILSCFHEAQSYSWRIVGETISCLEHAERSGACFDECASIARSLHGLVQEGLVGHF